MTHISKNIYIPIIFAILVGFFYFGHKIRVKSQNPISTKSLPIPSLKPNTPINILLLGYGGGNHEGTFLTDSVLLLHIDTEHHTVHMISIPRDLWVNIPIEQGKNNFWKINAAYAIGMDDKGFPNKPDKYKGKTGAIQLIKDVMDQVTGLPIQYVFSVDFDGFSQAIDTLGGVDVLVEKTFSDPEYPIENKENDLCGKSIDDLPELKKIATISAVTAFPCRYETLHFDSGKQHMDGITALKFVRSRHSPVDGSDFNRSNRQRNLLIAVKDKILTINFITKIPDLLRTIQNHTNTDIPTSEIGHMLQIGTDWNNYSIKSAGLSEDNILTDTFSSDQQYILTSREGEGKWDIVHEWIQRFIDPTVAIAKPTIAIDPGPLSNNVGNDVVKTLRDHQITAILMPRVTPYKKVTTININTDSIDRNIIKFLKQEFPLSTIIFKPDTNAQQDILITLGKDFNSSESTK